MPAISFSVFKDKILSGEKKQTIRLPRKNPIKAGDRLYLYWHQRSPNNELLLETVCVGVNTVKVSQATVYIYDENLLFHKSINDEAKLNTFAIADGFNDWNHMREWFQQQHGLPFEGVLIKWEMDLNEQTLHSLDDLADTRMADIYRTKGR